MKLTADERRRETKLILDGAWPAFPVLPVERDEGDPSIGIIVWKFVPHGRNDRSVRVYKKNLFTLTAGKLSDLLADVEYIEYPTLEAFYEDGWRGD